MALPAEDGRFLGVRRVKPDAGVVASNIAQAGALLAELQAEERAHRAGELKDDMLRLRGTSQTNPSTELSPDLGQR